MTSRTTPVAAQRIPELLGQTVVVIGGSAGIWLETARRARAEGVGAQRPAAFDAKAVRRAAHRRQHKQFLE